MSDIFDMTTLITIAVAVFVLMRLRSVLGTRTGNEKPPFEPFEIDRKTKEAKPSSRAKDVNNNDRPDNDNVVSLPERNNAVRGKADVNPNDKAIDTYAKPGTKLNSGLKDIAKNDASFDPENFINGAKMAYEMIVTSFADGDRKTLKNLLSREVYDGFAEAISEREVSKLQVRSTFIGIENAKIKSAEIVNNDSQVTVEFVSQIISSTVDANGKIVDGDPDKVGEVKDIWTFARDLRSSDPNWKLVATESEA